jgi:hypothetical protein
MDIGIEHIKEFVEMKRRNGMPRETAIREATEEVSIILALNNIELRGLFGETSRAVH